ncbi:hypothetical protein [Stappia sp. WLB 29]|uniref:hypothetical protein n=1 Tax=Stappia sp. WLB 29 TaxID=2925220 RepID=UPI0020C16563|nr:hypothetical protein [Stappia sp. WLB 29]
MRTYAIIAAMAAFGASSPATADFRLEMSGEEVREALGRRAVEDLEVGETASVRSLNTCSQDGGLFLYTMLGMEPIASGSIPKFAVTRLPNRRVSIAVSAEDGGEHAVRQTIIGSIAGAHTRNCGVAGMSEDQLFRVTTINGLGSDREVFRQGPQ